MRDGDLMGGFSTENIILLLLAIVFIYVVIKFIKGVVKLILTIILVFTLGYSLYNIFVVQKPISYEIDRYKLEYKYYKEIGKLSPEVFNTIGDIKEGKNLENNIKKLQEERNTIAKLHHTEESKPIHDRYVGALDGIITASKTAKNVSDMNSNIQQYESKLDINLKDLIFNKNEK